MICEYIEQLLNADPLVVGAGGTHVAVFFLQKVAQYSRVCIKLFTGVELCHG